MLQRYLYPSSYVVHLLYVTSEGTIALLANFSGGSLAVGSLMLSQLKPYYT